METVDKKIVMKLGLTEYQAHNVIVDAKKLMVDKKKCSFYLGKKIRFAPTFAVEEILGFKIDFEQIRKGDTLG
jgi:hypothetical protein